ncbi:acid-sensing ion channel 1 isoform X2, partial [Brachionus plicatilis]
MDLKKKAELKLSLKNALKDVVLSSTSHGIPNIIRSSHISLKVLWTCFTVLSAGACAYLITEAIITYFKYEVTTKTRVIYEYKPFFPTVTICNVNQFTSNLSENFIKNHERILLSDNPLERSAETKANILSKSPEFEKWKNLYGDPLEKLIVNCEFNLEKCNTTNFKFFLHPFYGNCYQFNSGYNQNGEPVDIELSMTSDKRQGLRLILNVSVPESLQFLSPSSGAMVFLHNQSTYPLMVNEISLSPRAETSIAFSRVYFESQQRPYSNCNAQANDANNNFSDVFKLVHANTIKYTQTLCVFQCFQRLIVNECKCFVSFYPSFFDAAPCSNQSQRSCANKNFEMFKKEDYFEKVCLEDCPLECDGMWFDTTVSSNQFTNLKFKQALQNYDGPGAVYFNKSINMEDLVAANIHFKSLNYIKITENPTIDIVGLISSIGGVAGLFLGISMLTLVEIFECLMQVFF